MRFVRILALAAVAACSGKVGPAHTASPGGQDAAVEAGRDAGPDAEGDEPGPDAGAPDAALPDAAPPDAGPGLPCPGGPTEIDLHDVILYANPPDLADWPITTTLTGVTFDAEGVRLDFSKRDGDGRWPDVIPPGWEGPLQYTIGMVECIDGAWYGSAVIEVWYGLDSAGGNVAADDQVALNWYYDEIRWGRLAGRQPATGEVIGLFVAAGNLRNITTTDPLQSPVMERSNVVLVPMPGVEGATHTF